jgi:hypothetical protein
MNTNYQLNNEWCLWYHSIKINEWDKNSYKLLFEIKTLFDVDIIVNYIKSRYFHNSMFFFMKKGVFPNWEDENNINGSCISLKIPKKSIEKSWKDIIFKIIQENLFNDDKQNNLNGISVTPKKEFNIFKFWFKTDVKNLRNINESKPYILNRNFVYKKNKPN